MKKFFDLCKKIFLDFISVEDPFLHELEGKNEDFWYTLCEPKEVHNTLSFFSYKSEPIKKAIWEIKYKNNNYFKERLVACAGEALTREFEETALFLPHDGLLLTSIPSHKSKKTEKGFNQSDELVKTLSASFLIKHTFRLDILKKIRATASQTTLTRNKRLENMRGAFTVSTPELIKDRVVIVFDDVVTTGTTLHEAQKTLLHFGAKKVYMVALARGG